MFRARQFERHARQGGQKARRRYALAHERGGAAGRGDPRARAVSRRKFPQKMDERMREVLSGVDFDETRLLTEVAVFADKSNIDEELTRLSSHIAQFRAICKEERVGRKLDFWCRNSTARRIPSVPRATILRSPTQGSRSKTRSKRYANRCRT